VVRLRAATQGRREVSAADVFTLPRIVFRAFGGTILSTIAADNGASCVSHGERAHRVSGAVVRIVVRTELRRVRRRIKRATG
jgi:hypothetical protein